MNAMEVDDFGKTDEDFTIIHPSFPSQENTNMNYSEMKDLEPEAMKYWVSNEDIENLETLNKDVNHKITMKQDDIGKLVSGLDLFDQKVVKSKSRQYAGSRPFKRQLAEKVKEKEVTFSKLNNVENLENAIHLKNTLPLEQSVNDKPSGYEGKLSDICQRVNNNENAKLLHNVLTEFFAENIINSDSNESSGNEKSKRKKKKITAKNIKNQTKEKMKSLTKKYNERRTLRKEIVKPKREVLKSKFKQRKQNINPKTKTKLRQPSIHTCEYCSRIFKLKCHYEEHLMSHTGEKKFTCVTCGRGFLKKYNMIVHQKRRHAESGYLQSNENASVRPYICDFEKCGKSFIRNTDLRYHKMNHIGEKLFKCTMSNCGLKFSQPRYLKRHLKKHHCRLSENPLTTGTTTGSETFKCEIEGCLSEFESLVHLKRHKQRTHKIGLRVRSREKRFECEMQDCGLKFTSKSNQRRHMKNKHNIYKSCDVSSATKPAPSLPKHNVDCNQNDIPIKNSIRNVVLDDNSNGNVVHDETSNGNVVHYETSNENLSHDETSNGNVVQDETSDGNVVQDETSDGNVVHDETRNGNVVQDETSNGNVVHYETSNGNVVHYETSNGNVVHYETSNGNVVHDEARNGNVVHDDTSKCCVQNESSIVSKPYEMTGVKAHFSTNEINKETAELNCSSESDKRIKYVAESTDNHVISSEHELSDSRESLSNRDINSDSTVEELIFSHEGLYKNNSIDSSVKVDDSVDPRDNSPPMKTDTRKSPDKIPSIKRKKRPRTKSLNTECDECHQVFKTSRYLNEHYRQKHTEEKPFTCSVASCAKSFIFKSKLITHERSHIEARPFKCDILNCGKSYKHKFLLKEHMLTHAEVKMFECSFPSCKKRFKTKGPLKVHERIHSDKKSYHCQFNNCGESFIRKSDLKFHSRTHYADIENRFVCGNDSCKKSFASKTLLARHQQTHSNEVFKCPFDNCKKIYNQSHNLKYHIRKKHS